jgi:4-amino-4-deoxy-L-arabinose transferase-like glycosyltransferase
MSVVSLIFYLVFLIPLTGLLIWVMRQDKRKGKIGLYILAFIVIVGVWFMYFMTKGK